MTPPAEKPVFSTTTAFSNAIDSINTAIADTTVVDMPDLLLEELPECVSIVQEEGQEPAALSQLATMPLLVEVDEDPFKVSASFSQGNDCGSEHVLTISTSGIDRCLEA